jgi:hypothetical protein
MPISHADHLVVTAPTLAAGIAYIEQTLGVTPLAGGEHVRLGTHNALLKLGHGFYLEVIAINPAASQAVSRARWFGLDQLSHDSPPRLATWVVRTNDIAAAQAAVSLPLGEITEMQRDALQWQITIPDDGRLVLDGLMPSLIQWHNGSHPTDHMLDLGCSLTSLEGFHPQAELLTQQLQALGLQSHVSMHAPASGQLPHLLALIQTPSGLLPLGLANAARPHGQ